MSEQALIPSPAQDLVEALDELSLAHLPRPRRALPTCRASTDRPVRDVDADELEDALARVRQSLRHYRHHREDSPHPGH